MKSSVFFLAHKIKAQFSTWSEALKAAWSKIKNFILAKKGLQAKLRAGKVSFSFIKKNGELRNAIGTLQTDYKSKSSSKKSPWYVVKFIDTEITGAYNWRKNKLKNKVRAFVFNQVF
jgi:hypothetical protein